MGIELLIVSIALVFIVGLSYVSWHLGRVVGYTDAKAEYESEKDSHVGAHYLRSPKTTSVLLSPKTNLADPLKNVSNRSLN